MLAPHFGQLCSCRVVGTPGGCWCMAACGTGCGGGVWALGTAVACGLADVVGGTDWVADLCCSEMQRKPHFGQYLDLWGRGSRQCGHSMVPQFLQNDWPGGICKWQTEQRVILGCTLSPFSDYFGTFSVSLCLLFRFAEHSENLLYYTPSQTIK